MLLRAIQSSTESSSNIDISFEPNDLLVGFKHPDSDKLFAQNLTSFGVVSISSIQIITDCIDLSKPLNQPLEEILTSPRGDEELIDKHKEIGSLRGWLEKRGFWLSKDWKRRWFSLDLEKARLYYYRYPEEESSNNYRGFIDLSEVTTVHETFIPGSSAIGEWRFEIHTPKRVWFLRASRKQEMEMWMFQLNQLSLIWDKLNPKDKKLNVNVLTNDLRIDTSTSTPGINTKPARLSVGDPKIEKENVHTFKCRSHIKPPPPAPKFEPDDFSQFGAPYGEEISNKDTILSNIDRRLGHRFPPDVEYIYVEPYLNYASKSVYLTANPYGHSAIRYTLPDTKEQLVMNIVGLADHELVNFLSPEDFFFSTNFDTKIGNEQGGIYNRNFASIRIQRVPPEKILAMHQYFLDLHSRSHTHWADYNIALGPLLNRTGVVSYGNCAHWASQGLRQAGLMKNPSMFPKAIWIDLFEELKKNCQHEQYSNNVSVVYYKRILHAKRFYGEDADWTGWGRPSDFFKKKTYENLEPFADVIVTVPSGSKKAILQTGSKSSLEKLEKKFQNLKQEGLSTIELRFDIHVEPRILFNEIFYTRIDARTLQKTKVNTELLTQDNPVKFFGCGFPIYSNSWMVDINDNLHRTYSKSKNVSDITWIKTEYPILSDTSIDIINCKCTQIAPNEDGSCWIIYGGYLFYRLENDEKWTEVSSPSDYHVKHIATVNMKEGVWVLDTQRKLYHWTLESSSWLSFPNTPKLDVIATGTNSELWGLTNEYKVYRRINSIDGNHWIQLHGALLKSIAVASSNEVWGIDPDGRIYIWSVDKSNELSEDIDSEITIVPSRMRWQSLGNILPISSIQVSSKSIPWAVSEYDPGYIYKISSHRLLVLSIKSARKIWDDKETGCKPFDIGFYRPLPPENFYSLGDIAERSHLENSQTEALVVCEVGKQPDELSILSKPIGFKRVFSIKNKDAKSGMYILLYFDKKFLILFLLRMFYLETTSSRRLFSIWRFSNNI